MSSRVLELVLCRQVRDQILRHACAEFPNEAVGILGGSSDGRISRCVPLRNIARNPARQFLAHPHAQFLAEKSLRSAGMRVAGIYHSHPRGGVGLSEEDLQIARVRGGFQLVVAPSHRHDLDAAMGAFEIRGSRPTQVNIRVDD